MPCWELLQYWPRDRRQLRVQGGRRGTAGARREERKRSAGGKRRLTGAGERWRLSGRKQLTVIQKKAPTLSRREPLQPGEPGVANGRRPIFLPKEMKQREIRGEEGGTRERWEVGGRGRERGGSSRRGCACVDVGCGAEVVDRGPLFLGIRLRQSSSSGPRNGKGTGLSGFWGC